MFHYGFKCGQKAALDLLEKTDHDLCKINLHKTHLAKMIMLLQQNAK